MYCNSKQVLHKYVRKMIDLRDSSFKRQRGIWSATGVTSLNTSTTW